MFFQLLVAAKPLPQSSPPVRSNTRHLSPRANTHTISLFSGSLPAILESLVSGGMCLSEWGILGFLVQSFHG